MNIKSTEEYLKNRIKDKILKKRKKRFKSEIDDSDFPVHEKYAKPENIKK